MNPADDIKPKDYLLSVTPEFERAKDADDVDNCEFCSHRVHVMEHYAGRDYCALDPKRREEIYRAIKRGLNPQWCPLFPDYDRID